MADHSPPPTLALDSEQLRTLLEPTRSAIVDLLSDGPATVGQLAEALDRPRSSIAHHCDALLAAGLIEVTSTRRIRAIDERFYGRTARTFLLGSDVRGVRMDPVADAARAWADAADADILNPTTSMRGFRTRRIPAERAAEWRQRLQQLYTEFADEPTGGDHRFGLVVALFPTTQPTIAQDES